MRKGMQKFLHCALSAGDRGLCSRQVSGCLALCLLLTSPASWTREPDVSRCGVTDSGEDLLGQFDFHLRT